jgi:hypothetical protein
MPLLLLATSPTREVIGRLNDLSSGYKVEMWRSSGGRLRNVA